VGGAREEGIGIRRKGIRLGKLRVAVLLIFSHLVAGGDREGRGVRLLLVVDLAELDGAVIAGSLLAGQSVGGVVAGQGGLVEDGGVAADEGPVGGVDASAEVVQDGQADVEHLKYGSAAV